MTGGEDALPPSRRHLFKDLFKPHVHMAEYLSYTVLLESADRAIKVVQASMKCLQVPTHSDRKALREHLEMVQKVTSKVSQANWRIPP